jgi:hypothetical protein
MPTIGDSYSSVRGAGPTSANRPIPGPEAYVDDPSQVGTPAWIAAQQALQQSLQAPLGPMTAQQNANLYSPEMAAILGLPAPSTSGQPIAGLSPASIAGQQEMSNLQGEGATAPYSVPSTYSRVQNPTIFPGTMVSENGTVTPVNPNYAQAAQNLGLPYSNPATATGTGLVPIPGTPATAPGTGSMSSIRGAPPTKSSLMRESTQPVVNLPPIPYTPGTATPVLPPAAGSVSSIRGGKVTPLYQPETASPGLGTPTPATTTTPDTSTSTTTTATTAPATTAEDTSLEDLTTALQNLLSSQSLGNTLSSLFPSQTATPASTTAATANTIPNLLGLTSSTSPTLGTTGSNLGFQGMPPIPNLTPAPLATNWSQLFS